MKVLAVGHGSDLPEFGTRLCAVLTQDGSARAPRGEWADVLDTCTVVSSRYLCKVAQVIRYVHGDTSGFSGLLGSEYVLEVTLARK
jgi:hypothetical protein